MCVCVCEPHLLVLLSAHGQGQLQLEFLLSACLRPGALQIWGQMRGGRGGWEEEKRKCLIQLLALDEKGQAPPLNVKQAPKSLLFHARAGIASLCLFDSAGETMGCLCGAGEQRRGDGAYIIITPPDRFYLAVHPSVACSGLSNEKTKSHLSISVFFHV